MRIYCSDIGRYLRVDPLGLAGGVNLFAYALMNPVVKFDVRGRNVMCAIAWQNIIDTCGDAFGNEYEKKLSSVRNCESEAAACLCENLDSNDKFCSKFIHCRGRAYGAPSCVRNVCISMQNKLIRDMLNKASNDPKCRKAVFEMVLDCIPGGKYPKSK